jgi:hypothetical protein
LQVCPWPLSLGRLKSKGGKRGNSSKQQAAYAAAAGTRRGNRSAGVPERLYKPSGSTQGVQLALRASAHKGKQMLRGYELYPHKGWGNIITRVQVENFNIYFFYCMINLMNVLIGFFSKQFVLYSALQNGYYFISLIAIIVSVISASYYLKIIKVLHTDHDYFEAKLLEGAVEENKAPNQSNVLLNEDKEFKEFNEVKEFKEGPQKGDCLTADIPIVTFTTLTLKKPKLGVEPRVGVSLSQSSEPSLLDLEQSKTTLTNTHSFLISSLTLFILLFFIKPSIILNSTQLLSLCAPYDGFC